MKDEFWCSLRFPSSTNTRKSKPRNPTKIQTFSQSNNWICLLTARNKQKSIKFKKKLEQKVRRISVPLIQSNDWKFLCVFLCLSCWVFDSISEKPPEPEAYDEGKGKRGACEVFLTMKEREMGGGQPTHWFYISTARAVFGCWLMLAVGSGASVIMRSLFSKSTAGLGAMSGVPTRSFWVIY